MIDPSLEPPVDPRRLIPPFAMGLGLIVVAMMLGVLSTSTGVDGPRVLLCVVGLVAVGSAVAARPESSAGWLTSVVGCGLAYAGIPESWDSFKLVVAVLAGVSLIGLAIVAMPERFRWMAASLLIVLHLGGIVTAITGEGDQPWLFSQLFARGYRPYLQFTNLNTAYHFFAPNPGAPNELWFGIEYDTPDPDKRFAWVVVPKRSDSHDPLWNSYYRRIKIPEFASPASELIVPLATELQELGELRDPPERDSNYVPHHPKLPAGQQLLVPNVAIQKLVLPSFVQHIAAANERSGMPIKSIRVYRVQHDYVMPEQLVGAADDKGKPTRQISPFDPTTYLPYYLGTFDSAGKLLPGPDALRWWLIPILAKDDAALQPQRFRELSDTDYERSFVDHVQRQAGSAGYRKGR